MELYATTKTERVEFGVIFMGAIIAGMGSIWALTVLIVAFIG